MGNVLAVLGILVGLFLIRNGVDSFVEWCAWLFTISGLCFLIFRHNKDLFAAQALVGKRKWILDPFEVGD